MRIISSSFFHHQNNAHCYTISYLVWYVMESNWPHIMFVLFLKNPHILLPTTRIVSTYWYIHDVLTTRFRLYPVKEDIPTHRFCSSRTRALHTCTLCLHLASLISYIDTYQIDLWGTTLVNCCKVISDAKKWIKKYMTIWGCIGIFHHISMLFTTTLKINIQLSTRQ